MADVFTKTQRSLIMARIRGCDNESTEMRTAGILRAGKITGWRRHSTMFGKPDFVFQKSRVALFVDGCFWHGCPRCYEEPTSSTSFWRAKLQRNMLRDWEVSRHLRKRGWKVMRVWECQLKTPIRLLGRLRAASGK
jgi:DNA mismatch endonuclease (patch repair protein)